MLRRIIIALVAVALLAVAWLTTAVWLFALPKQQPLHEADAIVSLDPASKRLPTALEAFDDGLAPRLWISHFPRASTTPPKPGSVGHTCAPEFVDADRVICFTPEGSTMGEARAVAELVSQSGTASVIVTTNTTHAARTRFLFESCLPAGSNVQMLLVDEPNSRRHMVKRLVYESAALVKDFVQVKLGGC